MNSNFRLRLVGLSLLVGVATITVAPISIASSGSVEDRVSSLERISNAQGQLLTQLQQQLSDNQRDIDSLRGQIQESQYQLNQIVERQKQIYQQIDNLDSKGSSSANSSAAKPADTAVADATAKHEAATAPATGLGNVNTDYNNAVNLVLVKKQDDQAISAFQAFIKQYPDSTYQPNANYWLGQLYYKKGKKDDAAYYFAIVAKSYPKSPKAPEAMYKVGLIMQEKGQTEKANAVFQQVIKVYPNSNSAKQAQQKLKT